MIRAFLKKVGFVSKTKLTPEPERSAAIIVPRSQHNISRSAISANALKVLYRLHQHGFQAYLVGGGVRDLLLGLHPKDFDVATNAKPEEVRQIFKNCRLIGRRFRLAHVFFGRDIVEVATFRRQADVDSQDITHSEQGMILRDNVYGTIEQDAWRRDFTINALYYNIADFSVVDFTGGYADLQTKRLRMIGDVQQRYREDPVRMLRAIRFACKTGFDLPKDITKPMLALKDLISHVSPARLFEEMIKLFHCGAALSGYELLKKHHLFAELFPATAEALQQTVYPTHTLLEAVFLNTDQRISNKKTVTPAFIIAALLWHPICLQAEKYKEDGMSFFPARMRAMEDLLHRQIQRISIPKRIVQGARDIWLLQLRMNRRHSKRVQQLMEEPRVRAALDFLELRAQAGENVQELARWWRHFIDGDPQQRRELLRSAVKHKPKKSSSPKQP